MDRFIAPTFRSAPFPLALATRFAGSHRTRGTLVLLIGLALLVETARALVLMVSDPSGIGLADAGLAFLLALVAFGNGFATLARSRHAADRVRSLIVRP